MFRKIKRNAIRCLKCKEVIESKHCHDFVECSCGLAFVDGGKDYLRRGFMNEEDIEELSEFEDAEAAET